MKSLVAKSVRSTKGARVAAVATTTHAPATQVRVATAQVAEKPGQPGVISSAQEL